MIEKPQIRLKNIGCIEEADIPLDGITVITGENQSGKSIVSKLLYATLRICSYLDDDYVDTLADEFCIKMSKLRHEVLTDLKKMGDTLPLVISRFREEDFLDMDVAGMDSVDDYLASLTLAFSKSGKASFKAIAEKLDNIACELSDGYAQYTGDRFFDCMEEEFAPFDEVGNDSFFELLQDGESVCSATFDDDVIDSFSTWSTATRVFYMDDSSVILEEPSSEEMFDHRSQMARFLDAACKVENTIPTPFDSIVTGSLGKDEIGKLIYVDEEHIRYMYQLPSSSRLFIILKTLVSSALLGEGDFLILDEPEAHLHPTMINTLAQTLLKLRKETKVNILINTVSPNLVLALDAWRYEEGIKDQVSFYLAQDNRFTKCEGEEMSKIYGNLTYGFELAYRALKRYREDA